MCGIFKWCCCIGQNWVMWYILSYAYCCGEVAYNYGSAGESMQRIVLVVLEETVAWMNICKISTGMNVWIYCLILHYKLLLIWMWKKWSQMRVYERLYCDKVWGDWFPCCMTSALCMPGPTRGKCDCGECQCLEGLEGEACDCSQDNSTCIASNGVSAQSPFGTSGVGGSNCDHNMCWDSQKRKEKRKASTITLSETHLQAGRQTDRQTHRHTHIHIHTWHTHSLSLSLSDTKQIADVQLLPDNDLLMLFYYRSHLHMYLCRSIFSMFLRDEKFLKVFFCVSAFCLAV